MPSTSVDGLISGLSTSDIISKLMEIERAPVTRMAARKADYDSVASAWSDVGSHISALRSSIDALSVRSRLSMFAAASSDESVLTATASPSAAAGSLTMRVTALAAAHQLTSAGFASATTAVGAGTGTIASGLSTLGVSAASADGTIAAGRHTVKVTSVSGTDATFDVDGISTTVTNWSPGGTITVNATGGALNLTIGAGLTAGTADVTVVRTTASTTLSELAAAISNASSSVSAQVIDTGNGATPVQLIVSAGATGTAHALNIDFSALGGFAGGFSNLRNAADATVTIGTGPNAINATRSSNTISDLLQGVTLHLVKADPDHDVTVAVNRDTAAFTEKVKNLVNGLNGVVNSIAVRSTYNPTTKTAGVLFGDLTSQRVLDQLYNQTGTAATSGTIRTLSQIGITIAADGKYALDETKLSAALTANYDDVVNLFARNGTSADGRLTFSSATDATVNGDHAVVVTHAATQASTTGSAFGTLTADETITVKIGSLTAAFTAAAGADADTVASGLNAQLSAAKLGVQASVVNGAIVLTTTGYGSATHFSVKSNQTSGVGQSGLGGAATDTYTDFVGTDVAGTIDGVAATGAGQTLTGATGDASGLAVKVTATDVEIAGAGGSLSLGALHYSTGVIGALSRVVSLDEGASGSIETAKDGATKESAALQTQMDEYNVRLAQVQLRYQMQFATLETALGQLKDQSNWLASQIASLK